MEYGNIVGGQELKRGQVWYVSYNDAIGSEESAGRPMVIVSSEEGLETSPVITGLFLTTRPKSGGYAVEVTCTARRSWVLCNQFVTADRKRLLKKMGELSEAEMLKVELSLRAVLGLPLKNEAVENELEKKSSELAEKDEELQKAMVKVEDLELELEIHKKSYERILDKLVDLRIEKDCAARMVEAPKPVEIKVEESVEELDLSGLSEKYKVSDKRKKISDEEVAATLEQAGMKKGQDASGKRRVGAHLNPDAETINVNTADLADFESIGIGAVTAKEIVRWRKRHGSFVSLEDMLEVPRFGKRCLDVYRCKMEV